MDKLTKHLVVASMALLLPSTPYAEFTLNFKPMGNSSGGGGGWGGSGDGAGGWSNVECNSSSTGGGSTGWGGNQGGSSSFSFGHGCGNGYFLQEVGNGYFHVIVGDPKDDFAIEWYIKSTGSFETALSTGYLDNADNPLSPNEKQSGNGMGNPTAVHIRELINDRGMSQEYLKALNAKKPKITQDINDSSITGQFVVDMSLLTYSQKDTPGTLTNKVTIKDPNIPASSAVFDYSVDKQASVVTAGMYTHPGGEFKAYTYAKDSFDVAAVKWIDYCDPKQNTDHKCKIGGTSGGGGWSSGGGGWGGGGGW
jgi:hypothetical protein